MKNTSKIIRTWKGWATLQNAPIYQDMLVNEVFPTVKRNGVKGLEKVSISTQKKGNEIEFFLVLQFSTLEDVKKFSGEDYRKAYIPDNARQVLSGYDKTAEHYELQEELVL